MDDEYMSASLRVAFRLWSRSLGDEDAMMPCCTEMSHI